MEFLSELREGSDFFAVAEICVPNTVSEYFSFGVDKSIKKGSVVWVLLRGRKEASLALVLEVHKNFPKFKLKPAIAHKSAYVFSEHYLERLLWCANYYMCSPGETLTALWPADLEKYLDV